MGRFIKAGVESAPRPLSRPKVILDLYDLWDMVDAYEKFDAFAFDTETMGSRPPRDLAEAKAKKKQPRDIPGLDAMTNDVCWLSFAGPGRSDVIPMGHPNGPKQLRRTDVFKALEGLFFGSALKIGHNVKFDVMSIAKYYDGSIPTSPYLDTSVMVFLLNENLMTKGGYNLENLAKIYAGFHYREKIGKNWWTFPFNRVAQYALLDAKTTWMLYWKLFPRFFREGREKLHDLLGMEMRVIEVLLDMYQTGAYIEQADLLALVPELEHQRHEIEEEIYRKVGKCFNLNSSPQKREVLFGHLKLAPPRLGTMITPGGELSTDRKVLQALARKHPVIKDMQKYADINKLLSTYVLGYTPHIGDDSRIRASYNQSVARTGRFSCSDPNLQNIPTRSNDSYESNLLRKLFKAPPGKILIVGDYNQIELRVLTHQTKDPTLLRAYREGLDLHLLTAARIYQIPEGKVTKDQRFIGKTSNFNFAFEGGPMRVVEVAGITKAEAERVWENWHKAYPNVKKWGTAVKKYCWASGYVETLYGRRRRLPEIRSSNMKDRSYAERQAVNHPIQGTAADIAKHALIKLYSELKPYDAHIIMQVHDEFVIEAPEDMGQTVLDLTKKVMESIDVLSVPLVADVHMGKTWDEAK